MFDIYIYISLSLSPLVRYPFGIYGILKVPVLPMVKHEEATDQSQECHYSFRPWLTLSSSRQEPRSSERELGEGPARGIFASPGTCSTAQENKKTIPTWRVGTSNHQGYIVFTFALRQSKRGNRTSLIYRQFSQWNPDLLGRFRRGSRLIFLIYLHSYPSIPNQFPFRFMVKSYRTLPCDIPMCWSSNPDVSR